MTIYTRIALVCLFLSLNPLMAFQIEEIAPMTDDYFRHSEGAAVRLPNGDILLSWSRFYAEEGNARRDDNAPANIVLARSTDGGRTWTEPQPLDLPRGRINNMQVSFLQLGNTTQLYYSKRDAGNAADKFIIESTDGGKTWSAPRQATPGNRRYTGPNDRMVQLSSGRILLPCHTDVQANNRAEHAPIILWSDDKGKTWTAGEPVMAEPQYYEGRAPLRLHEPALVERKDGSVWMLARTTTGNFYESVSTDGGKSWSTARPTSIEALTAPPQIKRLSDGRLLKVWNPYNEAARSHRSKMTAETKVPVMPGYVKRTILAAATSRDEGKTWSRPVILADGGSDWGYAYPSVIELTDRREILVFASKTPAVIYPASLVQITVPLSKLP
jgi:sialidase-1